MDDFDFLEALSSIPRRGKTKSAGIRDAVKGAATAAKEWAKIHKHEIAGGVIGGVASGVGAHAANKKDKKTGKSVQQRFSDNALKSLGKKNKKESFGKKVTRAVARGSKEYSDAAAEHPVAAGIAEGTAVGAPLGWRVAKKIFKK